MRVRLVDPRGPLWFRAIVPALSALLFAIALITPWEGARAFLSLAAPALFLLAPLFLPRLAPRETELRLGAGWVDVRGPLGRWERIRGRKLVGGTTAYTRDERVALTLQGKRTLTLELPSDDDAHRVRDALGIGHYGFGHITCRIGPRAADHLERAGRLAAGAGLLGLALGNSWIAFDYGTLFLFAASLFFGGAAACIGWFLQIFDEGPTLRLEKQGVVTRLPERRIPYEAIEHAGEMGHDLLFKLRGVEDALIVPADVMWFGTERGLTRDERRQIVRQIRAAAQRARGLGPPAPEVDVQIDELRRGSLDVRTWLSRLDAVAQRLQAGAAYRSASLAEADLWAALANHDADLEVRTAAARILARGSHDAETRLRIAAIAASARDRRVEERIRIVLDPDTDEAIREIEAIEADECAAELKRR